MTVVNPKSISGITSITTASGSDNLLTIHTNNGTERLRVDSTGATKIVTGIVTTLTATTGIVTTLTANTVTSLGAVSGTTGTFSGAVSGTTGTFSGDVSIADKIVHTGDTNTAIRFSGADTIKLETSGTERFQVDSSGNIYVGGVGGSATAGSLWFNDTSANASKIAQSNGNSALTFHTGSSQPERLRITSAGLVGINSTSATQLLDVHNNVSGENAKIKIFSANGGQAGLELIAGTSSANRASRIDFTNINTSTSPQWTIINDYQQDGTNHLGFYHGAEKSIVALPDSRVEIYNDNSKKFETNADGVIVSDNGSNNLNLHTNRFIVNRDEAFYFDQNNTGNAFIFRVSDSSALDTNVIKLEANGTMYNTCRSGGTTNLTLRKGNNGADGIDYIQARANNNDLKFKVEGDGDVRNANNSYGSSSDSKLKENIVDANSQWSDIKAVKVRNFNFISDSAKTKMIGVVAQELETVSAGLVSESIDRDPDTGADLGTTTKGVKYSILYMKSVKALQEAMTRIETLEAEVAALKGS